MWEIVRKALQAKNIAFVDTLPYLQKLIMNKVQPYPLSTDGHPNHFGHHAIAECIHAELYPTLSKQRSH